LEKREKKRFPLIIRRVEKKAPYEKKKSNRAIGKEHPQRTNEKREDRRKKLPSIVIWCLEGPRRDTERVWGSNYGRWSVNEKSGKIFFLTMTHATNSSSVGKTIQWHRQIEARTSYIKGVVRR